VTKGVGSSKYPLPGPSPCSKHHNLTSIISKILSGSKLPFPTFLMHVTTPLLVTDTSRLAKEQASSCRVASTTCRQPICKVRAAQHWCGQCTPYNPSMGWWKEYLCQAKALHLPIRDCSCGKCLKECSAAAVCYVV
jgi:hypothetical protein